MLREASADSNERIRSLEDGFRICKTMETHMKDFYEYNPGLGSATAREVKSKVGKMEVQRTGFGTELRGSR